MSNLCVIDSAKVKDIIGFSLSRSLDVIINARIIIMLMCICAQLHLTLCDPLACSPPGSPVHRISQARILAQVASSYFRGSS